MKTIESLKEAFWQFIGKGVNISGNEKIDSKQGYIYIFYQLINRVHSWPLTAT